MRTTTLFIFMGCFGFKVLWRAVHLTKIFFTRFMCKFEYVNVEFSYRAENLLIICSRSSVWYKIYEYVINMFISIYIFAEKPKIRRRCAPLTLIPVKIRAVDLCLLSSGNGNKNAALYLPSHAPYWFFFYNTFRSNVFF